MVKVKDLKPYGKNAKTHPEEQVELIANSIKEFGFKTPVVIDKDNVLVQGHGRRLASIKLGLKEVPALRVEDLTDKQIDMLRLADNKVAESEWDMDLLDFELLDLEDDFSLEEFGFNLDIEEIEDFEPTLPTGDREPIRNMTFTVSDGQHELIEEVLKLAKEYPLQDPDGVNENSNGNALYYICEVFKNNVS